MNSTNHISIESRSLAALKLKVAARKAFGWAEDGDQLVITDYTKNRPVKKYSQMMYHPGAVPFRQMAVS
jgi:hypothetical protein